MSAALELGNDDSAIRDLWRQLAQGWAMGSAAQFTAVFAQDVHFVSVRGNDEGGRAGVASRHAMLFAGPYRGTTLHSEPHVVLYLTPDIAVVHAPSSVIGPDQTVLAHTHAQAIVARHGDTWKIVAFHNMVPIESS